MTPKQRRHIDTSRQAIAPYNFVALPEKVVPAQPLPDRNGYDPQRLSGQIECTLTTETPLYIRAGHTPDIFAALDGKGWDKLSEAEKQEYAAFFHHGNPEQPVIPGSSLRGMLRSMIEIAGYGKVERVTDVPRYFFRAVAATKDDPLARPYRDLLKNVRAGYLIKQSDDWYVQPADVIENDSFIKVRERDIPPSVPLIRMTDSTNYAPQYIAVSFTHKQTPNGRTVVDKIDKPGVHIYEGLLVTSGNMSETGKSGQRTKRCNHCVVLAKGQTNRIKIATTAIEDYCHSLTEFQKGPTDLKDEENRPFSPRYGALQDNRPIFYCDPGKGKEIHYFGHSPNFRIPYIRSGANRASSPADFVPTQIRYGPRNQDGSLITDIAEALFGFVRHEKVKLHQACAGRVSISDGKLLPGQADVLQEQMIHPRILSGPKPTTFQHYLVQQGTEKIQLSHYNTPLTNTQIRGRKLYWHQQDVTFATLRQTDLRDVDRAKSQYTLIKPVRSGVSFTFAIKFEQLTHAELGALVWVLHLGSGDTRLKLGMGKPLGMGSIQVAFDLQLSDPAARYRSLFDGDDWARTERIVTTDELDQWASAFTDYVDTQLADGYSFAQREQIEQLRTLLGWPGMPQAEVRYMDLTQYRSRPVLPDPRDLNPNSAMVPQSQHITPVPQPAAPPTVSLPSMPPPVVDPFAIGTEHSDVEVIDMDVEGNVEVKLPGASANVPALIKAADLGGKHVNKKQKIRAVIIDVQTIRGKQVIFLRRVIREKQ